MENVKKVLYRILSIILSIVMVSVSFSGMSLVAEAEENVTLEKSEEVSADMELPENDELFAGYAEQLFYDYEGMETFSIGNQSAGAKLEGDVKKAYDALIPMIKEIAAGERTSTVIAVGKSLVSDGTEYNVDKEITFSENADSFDSEILLSALLADCPYELYWFDKVTGFSVSKWKSGETLYQLIFSFYVADNYQGTEEFQVNNSKVNAAKTAAENAKAILEEHESKSDYEKLAAYRNEICELVTYDNSAAETGNFSSNNDPWQLVHVFDGNTSTNVVCEGYSKAFQYLCDQSSFVGSDTACYSVTGTMSSGTGGGPHMWNIVSLANSNYLVDVTNCDSPAIGYPDKLFMRGKNSGSVENGYTVTVSGNNILYTYDDQQSSVWGDDLLSLADTDYTPDSEEEIIEKLVPQLLFEQETIIVTYTGEEIVLPIEPVATVEGEPIANPVITYRYRLSENDGAYIEGLPTEAGSYDVLATLTEDDNYTGAISNVLTLIIEEQKNEVPGDEELGGDFGGGQKTAYKITYELNGGSNDEKNPATYNAESEVILENPAKKGYLFDGWYSDCSFKNKVMGIEYGTTGTKIFYAKWTKQKYTITYSLNGGKLSSSNPSSYYVTSSTITLKNPTRKGYTSKGWYTESSYKNKITQIPKGSTGNKKLYAKWSAVNYKITYALNNGKNSTSNPATYTIATNTITLKNPTRKGYTFKGWYSDSKYKTKVTKISKGSTGSKKVYAKWAKTKYSITYSLNGGKNSSSNPSSYYVTSSTITLKSPTRKGYTFKGWYTNSDYTTKVTKIAKGSTGSKKLYAKWAKTKYSITYSLNGGKNSSSNPSSYYITSSTITLKSPKKTGYTFKGWYSDSKYKTKITKISKGSTGSKKVYAKWEANSYAIKFNRNGGDSGSMSSITGRKYGKSYTLPSNNYKRTGWTFAGWNTKKDGSGKQYKNKASVKNLTSKNGGTVTLYAQWKPLIDVHIDWPVYTLCNNRAELCVDSIWWEWTKYTNSDRYMVKIDLSYYKNWDVDGISGTNAIGANYVIYNSAGERIEQNWIWESNLVTDYDARYHEYIYLYGIPKGDYYIEFSDYYY